MGSDLVISRQYLDMFYIVANLMISSSMIFTYLISGIFLYFWHLRKYRNIGLYKNSIRSKALKAAAVNTLEGFFGGFVATTIVVMLGIVVNVDMLTLAVCISLILGIVSSNFFNLIYGCSIVSLFLPQKEIYSFMSIAFVMIFVQGILILISGNKDFIPIVSKDEKNENFGGYLSNRMWPISIGIVCLATDKALNQGGSIGTPKWWPLFATNLSSKAIFEVAILFVFVGSLKTVYTKTKKQSNIIMSLIYMVFGAGFLYITYIFKTKSYLPYFLMLLSIGLYSICEIYLNDTIKTNGKKFIAKDKVVVLDVIVSTLADYANIKPMDKILSINDIKGQSIEAYNNIIKSSMNYNIVVERNGETININVEIELEDNDDEFDDRPKNLYDLGIIAVPPNLKTD
jgi:hypothetical protein